MYTVYEFFFYTEYSQLISYFRMRGFIDLKKSSETSRIFLQISEKLKIL
jgi:hypothetical protein